MRTRAEKYIEENRVSPEKRPVFHITPPVGWMNDPNGLSVYKGEVHIFFQFHPYSTKWGPMHWGHYKSVDMLTWEELPVALAPDTDADCSGCFSGTAIERNGKHYLIYTGVTSDWLQNQCVAVGDGITYNKLSINPVIDGKVLPEGYSRKDFRDPKVFKGEDGFYYLLAGNKTIDEKPQVILFKSGDLESWNYESVFAADTDGTLGYMWECPDYFKLGGFDIIIMSPQGLEANAEFKNGNNVACLIGSVNEAGNHFEVNSVQSVDDGFDFYAPQTVKLLDGRRIMIGWLQSWESLETIPQDNSWAGMMTVPREIEIKNNRLIQRPVRELEARHINECIVNEHIASNKPFDKLRGRVCDMEIHIANGEYEIFTIKLAVDDRHSVSFSYDRRTNTLECDRSLAGWKNDSIYVKRMKLKSKAGLRNIRIVMDKYSAEAFINDGEQAFSVTYYTDMSADGIVFECIGDVEVEIKKYDIVEVRA